MKTVLKCNSFLDLSILVLIVSSLGCHSKTYTISMNDGVPIVFKHEWQAIERDGWKVERWVSGTLCYLEAPSISIRIMPLKEGVKTLPKVKVYLNLVHQEKKHSRMAIVEPEFEDCAKMAIRKECRWYRHGEPGETEIFPPKELCWEAKVRKVFKSEDGSDGTNRIERGEFQYDVKVMIEGLARFEFNPIQIRSYMNRGDFEKSLRAK